MTIKIQQRAAGSDPILGPSRQKTFFKLSSDPALLKVWITKMGLENFVLKDHSAMQGSFRRGSVSTRIHFDEDLFALSP